MDHKGAVDDLVLHVFGDASTQGVGAAVYYIVRQQSGITGRLVAGKGCQHHLEIQPVESTLVG